MSDREDFEEITSVSNRQSEKAVDSEENTEIYSTKRKITHIIRQNPLAHMGEKSEKPTVLEKLRRAFSTEDTYSGGFIADEEPEDGGLVGDSEDIFSEFVAKLKSARANKEVAKAAEESIQETNENNQDDESFEDEEEEFALLNSFLDSEDNICDIAADFSEEEHSSDTEGTEISSDTAEEISEEEINLGAEGTEISSDTAEEISEEEPNLGAEGTEIPGDTAEEISEEETNSDTETSEEKAESDEENSKIEHGEDDSSERLIEEKARSKSEGLGIKDSGNDTVTESSEVKSETAQDFSEFAVNGSDTVSEGSEDQNGFNREAFGINDNEKDILAASAVEQVSSDTATAEDAAESCDTGDTASDNEQSADNTAIEQTVEENSSSSADKLKYKTKQALGSAVGGVKLFCSKTKKKLVEMWNEKSETEQQESDTSENDGTILAQENDSDLLCAELVGEAGSSVQLSELEVGEKEISEDKESSATVESVTSDSKPDVDQSVHMKVIKNESSATMEIDTVEVRKNLNVITNDTSDDGDDFEILLEEPSIVNSEPKFSSENEDNVENSRQEEGAELFREEIVEETETTKLSEKEKRQHEDNQKVLDKVKEYERRAKKLPKSTANDEHSAREYEKEFGEIKPVTQIEITDYLPPGQVEEIKVKAGKFSESVRAEYEFYIGYKRLQSVAKSQSKSSESIEEERPHTVDEEQTYEYSDSSFEQFADNRSEPREHSENREASSKPRSKGVEYRSEEDKEKIKRYILKDYKKSKRRLVISSLLTAVTFILFCFNGKFAATTAEIAAGETGAERVFAVINLLIFGGALYACKDILADGLRPLGKLKVSPDTSVALACVVTAVQAILVVIAPTFFFSQSLNVYTLLALLALMLNSWGRYMTAKRAKENFAFVISSFNKYTARFYHDPRMTAKILSNTSIKNSKIVFQKRTSFLKNFIKLTYAESEGEQTSVRFVAPATVVSVIVSVIYAILSKSFLGAVSVLSVMLCMAVPMCCRLLGAFPMYQLSKSALKNQAMVVGYPAVEHFSDSCAIMIDAKELYPEGSVHMNGIKTFSGRKIDDALFAAAAVMVNAGGAMAGMFDSIIQGDKEEILPPVESLVYEDEKGLIGWVNNERVLVGNRFLLEKHGIEPPSLEYERKYRRNGDEILYLASSGELVAMFIIGYSANRRVMDALRRMESNGMSLLIRTVDVNITPERISRDFGIYHETVKILPTAMGNIIRDEMVGKEKSAPAYIATKGGVVPLGRAVSGCIKAKRNISLSIAIQIIEILLGLLLVTTIVLFSGIQAGIQQMGAIELFVFSLFWCVAVMIAPFIQKS